MIRDVVLTDKAEAQVDAFYAWWAKHRSLEQANRWYLLCLKTFQSLARNPERCSFSFESQNFPFKIRDVYFGLGKRSTHRGVFAIRNNKVIGLGGSSSCSRSFTP